MTVHKTVVETLASRDSQFFCSSYFPFVPFEVIAIG